MSLLAASDRIPRHEASFAETLRIIQRMREKRMKEKDGEWLLPSGLWVQTGEAFALTQTARGRDVSAQMSDADIAALLGATFDDSTPTQFYPPEFTYSPSNGERLGIPSSYGASGWVPPFGNASIDADRPSEARGLRRTPHPLTLRDIKSRSAEANADDSMELPPPGEYQFFSAPCGESAATLIAFDPLKGMLFGWLPASSTWRPLEGVGAALVDECILPHHAWRADMVRLAGAAGSSVLFVPTQSGLARITPDIASLTYDVQHIGDAPAVGAPVAFDNRIWIPLQAAKGAIRFIGVDSDGAVNGDELLVAPENAPIDVSEIGSPVSFGRVAVWACKGGQLRIQKHNDGGVTPTFTPWPANVRPCLDFGSPYLTSSGELWQVCFDTAAYCYVWVRIDRPHAEISPATTLRLCSGMVNFRITSKTRTPPWEEPEHSNDTASNDFVIPLLESSTSDAVIGLRLSSEAGIAKAFESKERVEYALCFDDSDNEVAFSRAFAAEPWRIRLFIHDGTLWAYHSRARRIEGWKLA
ncbi:hypothetical protein [Paraburkholderia graminis]|uniref:hypothetical protein n=1 Tax=Paraburkholderia graminis TaxID=60548 RepID=UPI0004A7C699|nr:hypothetical protein [Paraburkholderia graminis]MDQ0627096.1 hypothetical protein [Paraburkholderia graminis]